jgi:serine protease Do
MNLREGGVAQMRRKRDWIKLTALVGLAAILTIGFASIIDLPKSEAQPVRSAEFLREQQPQETVIPAARPLAELGNAFTAVVEAVRPAVVYIQVEIQPYHTQQGSPFERLFPFQQDPEPREGGGSGFLISNDGYILTNNHVVENATRVDVRLFDNRRFKAEVVGRDPDTDVAVIKIDADNLSSVQLGNSDSVAVGQWVLAIGTPLDTAFSFTVTAGIVSARGRLLGGLPRSNWSIQDFIQTDAAINRGNSGGPLVNVRGEVIGINSAIASTTGYNQGYGFAIPINLARHVAEQLITEGRVRRAALGVLIQNVTPEAAAYVGLDEIRGVVITGFPEGSSPAHDAGLRERDVIVEVDGEQVQYSSQLQQTVGFKKPGERIDVTVMRHGGVRRTYSVRLTEADTETQPTVARDTRDESEYTGSFEPRLGIAVEEFDRRFANRIGVEDEVELGLLITEVDRNGPARDKLNASSGAYLAIITNVDDERVYTKSDLENALDAVPEGEVVALRVFQATSGGTGTTLVFIKTADGDR